MNKHILVLFSFFLSIVGAFSQETSLDNYTGDWGNNASWSGGWTDGSPAFLNLPETNADITIYGQIRVGSATTSQNLTFAANKDAYDFTVNDTLIVYGDVSFANKAMNLNLGNGAVFIIMGNLDMNNKINIASGGTLVVSGNFNKQGSQGSYTGTGNVYAGSYSGDAESTIDNGTGGDSSFTIDDLSTDGFGEIEEFVTGGGTTPLPVDLLYFKAIGQNEIHLSWATASEINNDHFMVERSEDGKNFYEIGKVEGNGNTNAEILYEFVDRFVLAPVEYYRLKQVDFDGRYEYFDILRIETSVDKVKLSLLAFPTIIDKGILTIKGNQPYQIQSMTLYQLDGGKALQMTSHALQTNPTEFVVDVSNITKGTYLLKLLTSDGSSYTTRIIHR